MNTTRTYQPSAVAEKLDRYEQKYIYSVSPKNPPLRFSEFFPQRLGIFNQFFYTPIILSFLH